MLRRTGPVAALGRHVWCAVAVSIAAATTGAAEKPSLEAIRGRIDRQWKQVHSLHIRLRQETTLSAEPDAMAAWRPRPSLPRFSGTEDILFALDEEKRYLRVLGLDCRPIRSPGLGPSEDARRSRTHDDASAWNGTTLRKRTKQPSGGFRYQAVAPAKAVECFPPPQYLMNIGFAATDPTARREANDRLCRMWFLPKLLESPSYEIAEAIERIEDSRCLVVQLAGASAADSRDAASADLDGDKLWLDEEHGLALRKRELRVDDRLVRVVNGDFVEVLPGLWFPKQSRIEYFAPPDAFKQYQGRPVLVRDMRLVCHVANQVPSELFDVALTRRGSLPRSLFDVVRAYHYESSMGGAKEVWAAEGLGRRMELRKGPELLLLRIDTPAWSLIWQPSMSRATLLPSRLDNLLREDASDVRRRRTAIRGAEELTAVFRLQVDHLGDRKVDKITAYYPADPLQAGNHPIHEFDPELQRRVPGTDPRTREFWFDPTTGLLVHRRCGCKHPKWEATFDFPPPESIGQDRFTFELPPGARLTATDEELKRLFRSSQDAASASGAERRDRQ